MVQCDLTSHCYVCERLLQGKDVAAHLLDAPLVNTINVLRRTDQDLGN